MKVGILGYGEIGKSIYQLYSKSNLDSNIFIEDLNNNEKLPKVDVLNICIPYHDLFISSVTDAVNRSSPNLCIVHSTVKPGTTRAIESNIESLIVHSPVRGVHPNLYEGLVTFVKFIGANNKESLKEAVDHFNDLKINFETCESSETTELGKLLSTSYYGLAIAWHGEMKNMCDYYNVSFDESITKFNQTYNEGYSKLGMNHVVRPVLSPPKEKIGGHCVIPNAEILNNVFDNDALKLILKYN